MARSIYCYSCSARLNPIAFWNKITKEKLATLTLKFHVLSSTYLRLDSFIVSSHLGHVPCTMALQHKCCTLCLVELLLVIHIDILILILTLLITILLFIFIRTTGIFTKIINPLLEVRHSVPLIALCQISIQIFVNVNQIFSILNELSLRVELMIVQVLWSDSPMRHITHHVLIILILGWYHLVCILGGLHPMLMVRGWFWFLRCTGNPADARHSALIQRV